jgi:hypothetical protein
MLTTRREFLDDFLSHVNGTGDAEARNQAERLINRVIETIWLKRTWRAFHMPDAYEFSTVANTRTYALPDYFGRVASKDGHIRDLTTPRPVLPIELSELQALDPNQGTSLEAAGAPVRYAIAGSAFVHTQPSSSGDALEVVSDSASDVTVRAYIEGIRDGQWDRNQVTLNGTTPVAIGTWSKVLKFGKSYPDGTDATTELTTSEGTVTLRKVTGATELQKLLPAESAREVQTLLLYPVPDSVYSMAISIIRAPERLYRDADPIPNMWTNAIFEKMVISWRSADGDGRNIDIADTWPALVDLICFENSQAAQTHRFRTPHRQY